jgi:hypothetical protein
MQIASTAQQFSDLTQLMHMANRLTQFQASNMHAFCAILAETGARKGEEFFVYTVGETRMGIHEDNKPKLEVDFKYTTTEDDRVRNATLHLLIINTAPLASISGMY